MAFFSPDLYPTHANSHAPAHICITFVHRLNDPYSHDNTQKSRISHILAEILKITIHIVIFTPLVSSNTFTNVDLHGIIRNPQCVVV